MMRKFVAAAVAGLVVFLIALSSQSSAQSFGSLSNLLGGGSKSRGQSGKSSAAVTVQRDANPFVGQFLGKRKAKSQPGQSAQTSQGTETSEYSQASAQAGSQTGSITNLTAQFACYPAKDSALPQTKAFLCYSVE